MIATASEMKRRESTTAFSLIEVILAVAICAGAVVTIIALLPMLARDAGDAADLRAAQQLPGTLGVELRRIATVRGFDALATVVPTLSTPLADGLALVGARDGVRLKLASELAGEPAPDDQYFLIEVYRFSQPTLAYVPGGEVLPLHVRVSWPFRVRGAGTVTPRQERRSCGFMLAIHR